MSQLRQSMIPLGLLVVSALPLSALAQEVPVHERARRYAKVFDEHWERLDRDYPYYDRYGVDWKAEREEHRHLAISAESGTEFTWEMARMLTSLDDSHLEFIPSPEVMKHLSFPNIQTVRINRKVYIVG